MSEPCHAARTKEGYWTCDVPGGCPGCRRLARDIEDTEQLNEWNEQRKKSVMPNHEDIEIDWELIGVFDADPPFVYTMGLHELHTLPELWASTVGECGHRVRLDGLAMVLNDLAQRVVASDEMRLVHPVPYDFGSGLLTFTGGEPRTDLREELQTFQAYEHARIIKVTWRCCH